jgi:sugar phosphate isomerase/epimerase
VEPSIPRRGFIARASLLPFALPAGVAGLSRGASGDPAPIRRAGGPRLKTSLNAYSFSQMLTDHLAGRPGGLSLLDLLDYCAEHDFDALDPTGYFFPGYPEVPTDRYLNEFKRRAFQLGLDISGTGVRNDFAQPDRAKRAADLALAKKWVECAARMGAPVLRVFAGRSPEGHSWDEVSRWMADDLRACAEHGQKFGVLVGIQNHGDSLKTADDVLKIVRMVDSDWFGVIVDTGYFPADDPYGHIARVLPHAVNWQVKEKVDGSAGRTKIDLDRIVKIVKEGGYRGYLPIETLTARGEPYDPKARVAQLHRELRAAIARAG